MSKLPDEVLTAAKESYSTLTEDHPGWSERHGFLSGVTWLWTWLSEQSLEFDEMAAHEKRYDGTCFNGDLFIAGARWQFERDKERIALADKWKDEYDNLCKFTNDLEQKLAECEADRDKLIRLLSEKVELSIRKI